MGFERPEAYRRNRRALDPAPPGRRCSIKGNVSAQGERIYNFPGSRTYSEVRIDVRNGERWFCSAADAARHGWRPVRQR
ncbi:sunset domain-containing protein [Sphingomonas agrestis]